MRNYLFAGMFFALCVINPMQATAESPLPNQREMQRESSIMPTPATVTPQPDVVINSIIQVLETDGEAGPNLIFSVKNVGKEKTRSFSTQISYHVIQSNGKTKVLNFTRSSLLGLKPGKLQKFTLSPEKGGVDLDNLEKIVIEVDWKKQVSEINETNNKAEFSLDSTDDDGNLLALGTELHPKSEAENLMERPSTKDKPKDEMVKDDNKKIQNVTSEAKNLQKKSSNGLVTLMSVYPERAPVGTPLILRGSGFTKDDNILVFDNGYTLKLSSPDFSTLNVPVPEDRVPLCAVTNPQCMLPAPYNPVTPGEYRIYVGNTNGWSEGIRFTVIKQDELKDDPYRARYGDSECSRIGTLLSGCHMMPENDAVRFDGMMKKYVYYGTAVVRECAKEPVIGCTRVDFDYHTNTNNNRASTTNTTTSTSTSNNIQPSCLSWQYWNGQTCLARESTSATASARAYRGGIYFSQSWLGCMDRLGSTGDARRLQEYLNAGDFPPPWNSLTSKGQTDTATCEREAGWSNSTPGNTSSTGNANWIQHTWQFKNGSEWSYILNRTDTEYANFIAQVDASTKEGYFAGWKDAAGSDTASNWQNFGIPKVSTTQSTVSPNIGATNPWTCSSILIGLLGQECHRMSEAYFNGPMDKYVMPNATTVISCTSTPIQGCSNYGVSSGNSGTGVSGTNGTGIGGSTSGVTGGSGNQREQVWNSLGLRSWIRSDADQTRIESLKASCASVSTGSNVWQTGAGDYANSDFGMPDPTKCQAASSCSSGTYYNGSSCVSSGGNNYSSGSGSSSGYSTDPATACGQGGGSWNSSTSYCQMPNSGATGSSGTGASNYSSDPATACGQAGGSWSGSTCQMPNTSSGAASGSSSLNAKNLSQLANMLRSLEALVKMLR